MTTYGTEVLIMTTKKNSNQPPKENSKSNKPKIDRTSIKKTEVVKVVPTKEEKKAIILADSQQRAKDTFEAFAVANNSKRTKLDIQIGDVVKGIDDKLEVTVSDIIGDTVYYWDVYDGKQCETSLLDNTGAPQAWEKRGTLRELLFDLQHNVFAIRTTTKKRGMNTFRYFIERNGTIIE